MAVATISADDATAVRPESVEVAQSFDQANAEDLAVLLDSTDAYTTVARLAGTVGTLGGRGLGGIQVTAYARSGQEGWRAVEVQTTQKNGQYAFRLGAGLYRVGFTDPAEKYAPEYYPDQSSLALAGNIDVDPTIASTRVRTVASSRVLAPSLQGDNCVDIDAVLEPPPVLAPVTVTASSDQVKVWRLSDSTFDICSLIPTTPSPSPMPMLTISYEVQCNTPQNVRLIRRFRNAGGNIRKENLCCFVSSGPGSTSNTSLYTWSVPITSVRINDLIYVEYFCQCNSNVSNVCCQGFLEDPVVGQVVMCDPTGHVRTGVPGEKVDVTVRQALTTSCMATNALPPSSPASAGWDLKYSGYTTGAPPSFPVNLGGKAATDHLTTDANGEAIFGWSGAALGVCYYVVVEFPDGSANCPAGPINSPMAKLGAALNPFSELNYYCAP